LAFIIRMMFINFDRWNDEYWHEKYNISYLWEDISAAQLMKDYFHCHIWALQCCCSLFCYFRHVATTKMALGLLIIEVLGAQAVVHSTLCRTPLDKWFECRRSLPDNTQHSKERETHAPISIQMRNSSEHVQTYALGCIQTWALCHCVNE